MCIHSIYSSGNLCLPAGFSVSFYLLIPVFYTSMLSGWIMLHSCLSMFSFRLFVQELFFLEGHKDSFGESAGWRTNLIILQVKLILIPVVIGRKGIYSCFFYDSLAGRAVAGIINLLYTIQNSFQTGIGSLKSKMLYFVSLIVLLWAKMKFLRAK